MFQTLCSSSLEPDEDSSSEKTRTLQESAIALSLPQKTEIQDKAEVNVSSATNFSLCSLPALPAPWAEQEPTTVVEETLHNLVTEALAGAS